MRKGENSIIRFKGECKKYLMPETYSKPCQVSMIITHIENPGIARICSGIFRHIQGHSVILSHVQAYWGILRHIQALLRHTELYSDIFRTPSNPCIYNHAVFRTLTHLEPEASSKGCQICKMTRHDQSPGIVRTLCNHFQGCLGIFRDNSCIFVFMGGRGQIFSILFWNTRKMLWFWKRDPFFSCYLSASQPTLGPYQVDSLTNLMLITAF